MIGYSLPSIDFKSIRAQHGTQHGGFEELCVSLFREEIGEPFSIIRIEGTGGDGGVEAYAKLGPRKIIGLQVKYFRKLGASQWRQIRASIKQAKKSHPSLQKYYLATPLDLTPAAVRIWNKLQREMKMLHPSLKLIWWGQSALTHLLTEPAHAGRTTYWFGIQQFDPAWLDRQNARARADLDTRYTPEHHIRVQSQGILASFAGLPTFVKCYYEQARLLWKAMREAAEAYRIEKLSSSLSSPLKALIAVNSQELPRLGDGIRLPTWSEVKDAVGRMSRAVHDLLIAMNTAIEESKSIPPPPVSPSGQHNPSQRERLKYRRHEILKADDQLYEFDQFLSAHMCVDKQRLLVTGQAGSGKSHLLAKFVEDLRHRGQYCLFVLGEYFTTSADPWSQLVAILGWSGSSEDLLAALNYAGEVSQARAVIIVDAVNETSDRTVWLNHLAAFSSRLDNWPWINLVISCRSDFVPICLPASIAEQREEKWAYSEHRGFADATSTAVSRYFAAYRVQARDFPPFLPEFQNPLFLKTFCEAFENSQVPHGPITLDRVMRKRVETAGKLIEKAIDCPADVTWSALDTLAGQIAAAGGQPVSKTMARPAIEALFPGRGRSHSLYQHLCSTGLVVEVGHFNFQTGATDVRIRFSYERFSDYFIATRLLAESKSIAQLRINWSKKGYLKRWNTVPGYIAHRGLLTAMAILLPGKYRLEVANLITNQKVRRLVLEDFFASLQWRDRASFALPSKKLVTAAANSLPWFEVLSTLIRLASVPDHPWNSRFLHAHLDGLKLWQREAQWTIPISQMLNQEGQRSVPSAFVLWIFGVSPKSVSDEQAHLVAIVLCWFLSSNDRGFRRRSTLAAIHILQGRAMITAELIDQFYDVNDPYVVEGVLAVAAGVAVREHTPQKLATLAEVVWCRVFKPRWIRPHILQRDYAFTILEIARERGCLPVGVDKDHYQPPYRSRWPKIWSDKKSRLWSKREGWERIVHSIEPEYGNGIGGYGDFGRYTMEAHMRNWLKVPLTQAYPKNQDQLSFDSLVARSWVLQRVVELGWTPERYNEYEKHLREGRSDNDTAATKQERISKKYQWIALYELEALACDHFHFADQWGNGVRRFEGAWQSFSRNFDPAQPLRDPCVVKSSSDSDPTKYSTSLWGQQYPDPFRDITLVRNPSAWVRTLPDAPSSLLTLPSAPGIDGPAVLLNGWFNWNEPEPYPPRTRNMGKAHQWIHVRSWIVPKADRAAHLRFLRKTHFWGDGVMLPQFGSEGLGGYPWADRFKQLRTMCVNIDKWGAEFPPGFIHTTSTYSRGDTSASVPSPQLADLLELKWSGQDFDFIDKSGKLIAFSPHQHADESTPPCFVERNYLLNALGKQNLSVIWAMVGERNCFDHYASHSVADSLVTFSAVYFLNDRTELRGGITMRDVRRTAACIRVKRSKLKV